MGTLDHGEREAIQLAMERHAAVLIIDEWKGRAMAQRRHIPLTGAIGILGESYQRMLIDHPLDVLADMRRQGFRINAQLVKTFDILLRTRYAR